MFARSTRTIELLEKIERPTPKQQQALRDAQAQRDAARMVTEAGYDDKLSYESVRARFTDGDDQQLRDLVSTRYEI
jgi:hypothetical protein